MRVVSQYIGTSLNAGPKAKMDVEKILNKEFNAEIFTNLLLINDKKSFITKFKKLNFYLKSLKTDDLAIIQHPLTDSEKVLELSKNKIAFIHDIEGLRTSNTEKLEKEIIMFKKYNKLIVHNTKMKDFLVKKGINEKKIYILELFDYLYDGDFIQKKAESTDKKIVYTGNLDKAAFLNQLDQNKMCYRINVYGTLSKKIDNIKIDYKGSFLPDELPGKIDGDLGLIWDGNYDDSDEYTSFKYYTMFNNPHKLSCYIVAGLPVIVWEKSAIADFVSRENIGYVIKNLYDINNLNFDDYNLKMNNVSRLSEKVKDGYYTKKVMNIILKDISD